MPYQAFSASVYGIDCYLVEVEVDDGAAHVKDFNLPMALGLTGCMGNLFGKRLDHTTFLGELSLDGSVHSVRGALSDTLAAREARTGHSVPVPTATTIHTSRGRLH